MRNKGSKDNRTSLPRGVIFNAYPDSIGGRLSGSVDLLKRPELKDVFSQLYILPTIFHSDLDRGFSVIDYDLNEELVVASDLEELCKLGISLKLDLVVNHLSVNSPQFQDLLQKGDASYYKDFFIDWNSFWRGHGNMGPEGYKIPKKEYLDKLFMRKPGLPVMEIEFLDGTRRFFWNTFYREVKDENGKKSYLGQLDLNGRSEIVWAFFEQTFEKLRDYGALIIRLDAFAYLHKEVGESNFFNRPGTWDYLARLDLLAQSNKLAILPEIHSRYGSGLHKEIAGRGYPFYDFFFPGLIIDALERRSAERLLYWIDEIKRNGYRTINMLGCHDGIPLLDLKGEKDNKDQKGGLLTDRQIDDLVDLIVERGGRVKDLYGPDGSKISYYQVNATFFSALGENESKLLLARAIQLFMPGIPQVWYLDLFAGKNDYAAADLAGTAGHKEINRTNLSLKKVKKGLKGQVVKDQLTLLHLRNTSPAFTGTLMVEKNAVPHRFRLGWRSSGCEAILSVDLRNLSFTVRHVDQSGKTSFISHK